MLQTYVRHLILLYQIFREKVLEYSLNRKTKEGRFSVFGPVIIFFTICILRRKGVNYRLEGGAILPNNQFYQNFQAMRAIINNLKQSEQQNVMLARQLAGQEANNANLLNNAGTINLQTMANGEAQAATILSQFENAERHAVQQLDQLEQLVSQVQSQLS